MQPRRQSPPQPRCTGALVCRTSGLIGSNRVYSALIGSNRQRLSRREALFGSFSKQAKAAALPRRPWHPPEYDSLTAVGWSAYWESGYRWIGRVGWSRALA